MNTKLPGPLGALVLATLVLATLGTGPAAAEICWDYTDLEPAKVPLKCVQMGDGVTPCTWNPGCNTDLDPSDCCMAVHDPSVTQTIGEMHLMWHTCLGNVGTAASPPPPNRGLRWMAFHRQFEWDFNVFREANGFGKIDSLDWCPGMVMPYGHFGANLPFGAHPLGCGTGPNRPGGVTCDNCLPFSPCLYLNGAGPAGCPSGSPTCSAGGVTFPYTSLDQFQNADEIATLLDTSFHGNMHGDVSFADGGGYNADCSDPSCSTRDPMFWRLHKALDDVIRAWQNVQAVDVTLVIDRSGSMSAPSGTGVGTRLQNAVEAADMFGDLLEEGRSDGAVNRIGIVSYSTNAANAALNLPLQDVDATLRNPGGPFETTLAALTASGSTSIGSGVVGALGQLCAGNCATYSPAPGENTRKAMLLLTDGLENTAPCLEAGCQWGNPGGEIDYSTLDVTQACAVGLGNAAAINGELLTIFAERQGGIYLNNTDATGDDLKDFFTKCFAELTDEFIGLDPAGTIAAADPAGPIVPFESCDDKRLTFTAGWNRSSLPGDHLRFLVTTPAGNVWAPAAGYGEQSTQESWAFKRCPLPYGVETGQGVWNMQLLRPQRAFVNGFTSDAFADPGQGVRLVRRQIQRLCPVDDQGRRSCERVLFFEDGARGESAYAGALRGETGATVGEVGEARSADELDRRLREGSWDLVVYAHQAGADRREVYDGRLADLVCRGTRAIVTDTRSVPEAANLLRCAGAARAGGTNLKTLQGGDRFLPEIFQLANPGYAVFSYGLASAGGSGAATALDASFTGGSGTGAILGQALAGGPINWHKNVLVTGLSKLTAFPPRTVLHTGEPLKAAVRILQPYQRAGGYPGATMTVEVERPTVGLGSLVKKIAKVEPVSGDPIGGLEQQLGKIRIPTRSEVYTLSDDGKNGDENARNGTFTADLPISAAVDGMYTYHFRFAYPAGSCQAHRELKHSLFVAVKVDPEASNVQVGQATQAGGGKLYPVQMSPRDLLGNVVGPGRSAKPACAAPCSCDARNVVDHLNGSYTIPVLAPAGVDLQSCTLDAFGARFTFR